MHPSIRGPLPPPTPSSSSSFASPSASSSSRPSAWSTRHAQLQSLEPELRTLAAAHNFVPKDSSFSDNAHSPAQQSKFDSLLDFAQALRENHIQDDVLVLLSRLKLKTDDFQEITCLSSSQFGSVNLVSCRLGIKPKGYVMKTVQKRFEYRLRDQSSLMHERSLLHLAIKHPSPHIPQLIASFQNPTTLSILLEYLPGGSLQTILDQKPLSDTGLPEHRVAYWAKDCIEAIDWVHEKGWVHRDVKPQNLLLTMDGIIKLADFGSAAPFQTIPTSSSSTSTSTPSRKVISRYCLAPVGTVDYLAPEILNYHHYLLSQAEQDSSIFSPQASLNASKLSKSSIQNRKKGDQFQDTYGPEVDWWSLGSSLYELLYGIAPFFADSIPETYDKIISHHDYLSFPTQTKISVSCRDFIRKLLQAAPERLGTNGTDTVRQHRWIRIEIDKLDTPRFIPKQQDICVNNNTKHQNTSTLVKNSANDTTINNNSKIFDFSAFFSSPGLSILRNKSLSNSSGSRSGINGFDDDNNNDNKGDADNPSMYRWVGFTFTPGPNAFDTSGYDLDSNTASTATTNKYSSSTNTVPKTTTINTITNNNDDTINDLSNAFDAKMFPKNSFVTPVRPTSSMSNYSNREEQESSQPQKLLSTTMTTTNTTTSGTSSNRRRGLTDLEAWSEMLDYAVASAKKSSRHTQSRLLSQSQSNQSHSFSRPQNNNNNNQTPLPQAAKLASFQPQSQSQSQSLSQSQSQSQSHSSHLASALKSSSLKDPSSTASSIKNRNKVKFKRTSSSSSNSTLFSSPSTIFSPDSSPIMMTSTPFSALPPVHNSPEYSPIDSPTLSRSTSTSSNSNNVPGPGPGPGPVTTTTTTTSSSSSAPASVSVHVVPNTPRENNSSTSQRSKRSNSTNVKRSTPRAAPKTAPANTHNLNDFNDSSRPNSRATYGRETSLNTLMNRHQHLCDKVDDLSQRCQTLLRIANDKNKRVY